MTYFYYQMGKFYELFEMDAHIGVRELDLQYMKVLNLSFFLSRLAQIVSFIANTASFGNLYSLVNAAIFNNLLGSVKENLDVCDLGFILSLLEAIDGDDSIHFLDFLHQVLVVQARRQILRGPGDKRLWKGREHKLTIHNLYV